MVKRTIQQYQLLEQIGAGGMGEIYKARDTRLNRFVALKVLPPAMSADPDRRRRFVQEAQAASALNHPNIITIYDIVNDGGTQYMVVEYVTGKTLLELIPKEGLRVPQVIQYATQMAEALTAAHAARIIHRDLKPANVMVTTSGLVKLLDFGLAKIEWSTSDDLANTATVIEAPLTMEGTLMGTVNYMSPEQAEGKKIDARSDIFSFGAVVYEMLTGSFAFHGNSMISTLSAVLRDEVRPIAEVTSGVPPELERIVMECLKKNPDERYQSMREVLAALTELKLQSDSGTLYNPPSVSAILPPVPAKSRTSKALVLGVAAALVVAAAVGGVSWLRTPHAVSAPPVPQPPAAITNNSVLEMLQAGVEPSVIVSQIRSSKTDFDLSSAEVIRLSKAGVPAAVIEVMRNPLEKPSPAEASAPVAAPKAAAPALPAPEVPPAAAATATVVLGDGLPIHLTLTQDVRADAAEGEALQFQVAGDVRVNDIVAIPKGAAATGFIVTGAKKRVLSLGGKMTLRFDSVTTADGQKVSIRATPAPRRDGVSTRPVDAGGKKSKDVAAPAGTDYVGYIDGSSTLTVKK